MASKQLIFILHRSVTLGVSGEIMTGFIEFIIGIAVVLVPGYLIAQHRVRFGTAPTLRRTIPSPFKRQ